MKYLILFIALFFSVALRAQPTTIKNFIVKENLSMNNKLAVIATDSLDRPIETINGSYTFTVSGFTQEIKFNDGVAVIPLQIDKSTFVYIKHSNDLGTSSKLLYVFKSDNSLKPITINRFFLIAIPIVILILAFAFKRFIYIGIVLFLAFLYFNYTKGLSLDTFFETILDYLKKLI